MRIARFLGVLVGVALVLSLVSIAQAHADTPTVTITHGQPVVVGQGGRFDSVYTDVWQHTTVVHRHRIRHRIRRHRLVLQRIRHHRPHPRFRVHVRVRRVTHNWLYGMISNTSVWMFRQAPDGALSDPHMVLTHGGPGSVDQCGVHPAGSIYKVSPTHWVTFYHAEQAAPGEGCATDRAGKHTRWTIREMQTWNAGQTWVKGGAVVTQDTNLLINPTTGLWNFACDDTGEVHLTVRGPWMYLMYDACNEVDHGRRESIARAPVSSLGAPGSWWKWYDGSWSQPGLGGQQSSLQVIPTGTRGVTWNSYLNEYLAVSTHVGGTYLYVSHDLINWSPLGTVFTTGLSGDAWGHCTGGVPCPAAYGYGSLIGLSGSASVTGQSFYVYFMYKPANESFDSRVEERELVTLGA